jgi:hypothetical protein
VLQSGGKRPLKSRLAAAFDVVNGFRSPAMNYLLDKHMPLE